MLSCRWLQDFREKNSDLMRHDIMVVLKNSCLSFVREIVGQSQSPLAPAGVGSVIYVEMVMYNMHDTIISDNKTHNSNILKLIYIYIYIYIYIIYIIYIYIYIFVYIYTNIIYIHM